MFLKLAAITLMAFIATSQGSDEIWTGLQAKWSSNTPDGYYDMPKTVEDAELMEWRVISFDDDSKDLMLMGYRGDPRIALIYSKETGEVIGFQVAFLITDIEACGSPGNFAENVAYFTRTLNGEEYYTARAFFHVDKETGARKIFTLEKRGLIEHSTDPHTLMETEPYYENLCVKWMGTHYYYINSTTDCNSLYPWLFVGVKDHIVGMGFLGIGGTSSSPDRTWWEVLPNTHTTIRNTIPTAPLCLADDSVAYGYMLFHIYFLDNVLDIVCTDAFVAEYNTTSTG